MVRATRLAVGSSLILLTTMVRPSGAAEQQFSCKGQVVQEMTNPAVRPKPIDLNVTVGRQEQAVHNERQRENAYSPRYQQQQGPTQVCDEGVCWRIFPLYRRSISYLQLRATRAAQLLALLTQSMGHMNECPRLRIDGFRDGPVVLRPCQHEKLARGAQDKERAMSPPSSFDLSQVRKVQ